MDNKLSFPLNKEHPSTIGAFLHIPLQRQEVIEEYISEIAQEKVPIACAKLQIAYGEKANEFSYALYCLGAYREQEEEFEVENTPTDDIGEEFQ